MASKFARDRGYDGELFEYPVSDNFKCSICLNVLKNPKSCGRNQHYFCFGCIGQHLENSHTCPECMEVLTPDTLMQPPRLLLNCISELRIKCSFNERGCPEFVLLARLQNHEDECEFAPATCGNDGCGAEINKRDKLLHESTLCKFRKVECDGCEVLKKEMEGMKENMEKEIGRMKRDQEKAAKDVEEKQRKANEKQMELEKKVALLVERMKKGVKGILAVSLHAEVERIFGDTQSDSRPEQDTKNKDHIVQRSHRHNPPINHDIIIIGGAKADDGKITNSVEKFCCKEGKWIELAPMIVPRSHASSVVFENQVIVSGGRISSKGSYVPIPIDSIEILSLDQRPLAWAMSDAKLPKPMFCHQTFVYQKKVVIFYRFRDGPIKHKSYSTYNYTCKVFEVSLTPPHDSKELYAFHLIRSQQICNYYTASLINHNLFIFGPGISNYGNVVVYDLLANELRRMPGLPHPGWWMSTVIRSDQIILLGGWKLEESQSQLPGFHARQMVEKKSKDVMIYDTETGESQSLPPMTRERNDCTAVLTNDVIIVMGGEDNSVELYDFRTNAWHFFKAMKYAKRGLTAVVSPL
ncbi:uncharacterized protein LOC114539791 [Dendronephthya gigantea]|uniref:uncharacterized protein LOC114539791 n=1 Tax=Dendronephthya gigantea TaxID=151771 RepID=UPI00106B99D3|nr:uncharacterized protein LOC114539791 [Dendronephthya gigantea]